MPPCEAVIRQAGDGDVRLLATIIRDSFQDIAERFGLTPVNCPTHPSNCTDDWIRADMDRGVLFYLLELSGSPLGCVAMETADPGLCYLMRLAVLPGHRHRGFGGQLVAHVLQKARGLGMGRVGIGIIHEQEDLKAWYRGLGFNETGTRRYLHLPFTVGFMEYPVQAPSGQRVPPREKGEPGSRS